MIQGGREGGREDLPHDITTGAHSGRPNVHDRANNRFEVALQNAVNLKALSRGGSQVVLPVVGAEVIDELVQLGGDLASGGLEAEHELVFLGGGREGGREGLGSRKCIKQ